MTSAFDFNDLFIFELANNHQGQVEHGLRVIREIAAVAKANGVRGALKFQFRQLPEFVHPAHRQSSPNKHVARFLSTKLTADDFRAMTGEVRKGGLIPMSTPFDEESVELVDKLGIDVIKIGSCSATDWPLIERIAEFNKPVVFSTGGVSLKDIDDLVSFFDHRRVHFAIMHCVSIYPTPPEKLQLNQIEVLRRRYPGRVVGFSTHESPDDLVAVRVAVAKGARVLERHVGVATDTVKLNSYSSTPAQIDRWIKAALEARAVCGPEERPPAAPEEIESLLSLKRGVYARKPMREGVGVGRDDVYFALPCLVGQLSSGEWDENITVSGELKEDDPLMKASLKRTNHDDRQVLFNLIHLNKAMLNEARIALPTDFQTEFSHHYGIANLLKVGATIITCINRTYCKKLILLIPGQRHPNHYHKKKEETFYVLHGVLEVTIEGRRRTLHPGDTLLIQQGVWHEFWSETGVIFEEVSTTHFNDDSFYEDKTINAKDRDARKTLVNQWGRYQI